jgi:hypothetical protein
MWPEESKPASLHQTQAGSEFSGYVRCETLVGRFSTGPKYPGDLSPTMTGFLRIEDRFIEFDLCVLQFRMGQADPYESLGEGICSWHVLRLP